MLRPQQLCDMSCTNIVKRLPRLLHFGTQLYEYRSISMASFSGGTGMMLGHNHCVVCLVQT